MNVVKKKERHPDFRAVNKFASFILILFLCNLVYSSEYLMLLYDDGQTIKSLLTILI